MSGDDWHRLADGPARRAGIDVGTTRSSVAVAVNGRVLGLTATMPSAVLLKRRALLVGDDAERERPACPGAYCAGFPAQLGQRRSIPVWDTFYRPEHLICEVIAVLRDRAEGIAGGPVSAAVVAYPAALSTQQQQLLEEAARCAGLTQVQLVPAPEAAVWALVTGPTPAAGTLLVEYDLGVTSKVTLLEAAAAGYRLISHSLLERPGGAGAAARDLVTRAGRAMNEVHAAYVVGGGALDRELVAGMAGELGVPLRIPDDPQAATAAGAARWQPAVSSERVLGPEQDVLTRLGWLVAARERDDDHATAARARELRQEIWEQQMGVPPADGDPLAEAETLLAAHNLARTREGER